jgi:hypothetical protein
MAPIFVGSNSDDSRIRSNRVGFAVSTANPGSAAEGDVYFNSTDNKLRAYDGSDWANIGAGGGTFTGIASGTLSNGQTVIVHSDGKVGGISSSLVGSTSASFGDATIFHNSDTEDYNAVAYDANAQRVVIAYRDQGDSNKGKAVVGTITGTAVTFGSEVQFESGSIQFPAIAYDANAQKVVISYEDTSDSGQGTAVVGTVSGSSISFGTPVVYETGRVNRNAIVYDSTAQKVILTFQDNDDSNNNKAIVGTVSGTSISFGTAVTYNGATTNSYKGYIAYDSNADRVVIFYGDSGNSEHGYAIVGTVSGTSISFGTEVQVDSSASQSCKAVYDSENQKVVVIYIDTGNSYRGTARVGTVSGTSISFGSEATFSSAAVNTIEAVYDSSAKKVIIAFRDENNSNYGAVVAGTVSGTDITFGTKQTFESANSTTLSIAHDSGNNKNIIIYADQGNSKKGTAIIANYTSVSTTLTSSNFLGFSDAAYTNGQTATVQIVGSVDDAQTGLTTGSRHFVQNNGTLSTTAGSPSVLAGTAISATKIIIRK